MADGVHVTLNVRESEEPSSGGRCFGKFCHGRRGSAAAQQSPQGRCGRCCSHMRCFAWFAPWVPIISCAIFAGALPVWWVYTHRARLQTLSLFDTLNGGASQDVQTLADNSWLCMLVATAVMGAAALCIFLLSILRVTQRTRQEGSCMATTRGLPGKLNYGAYLTLSSVFNCLMWFIALALLGFAAGETAWYLGNLTAQQALKLGVSSAPVATPMESNGPQQQLSLLLQTLGAGAKNTAASADMQTMLTPDLEVGSTDGGNVTTTRQSVCPATCLDLGSFAVLLQLSDSCYCDNGTLATLASTTDALSTSLSASLISVLAMFFAATWLLMHLSAQFAHTRRDMHELKRAARRGGDFSSLDGPEFDANRGRPAAAPAASAVATAKKDSTYIAPPLVSVTDLTTKLKDQRLPDSAAGSPNQHRNARVSVDDTLKVVHPNSATADDQPLLTPAPAVAAASVPSHAAGYSHNYHASHEHLTANGIVASAPPAAAPGASESAGLVKSRANFYSLRTASSGGGSPARSTGSASAASGAPRPVYGAGSGTRPSTGGRLTKSPSVSRGNSKAGSPR